MKIDVFQRKLQDFYHTHRRDLPWRTPALKLDKTGYLDPYAITVSEIMLQQTQVPRVVPKFQEFLQILPTIQDLAEASLADVLTLWSGLGYNRRARYLHQLAQVVVHEYGGKLPDSVEALVKLPGVGTNTAGAILAYAYNQPTLFVETNIRSVYIQEFFPGDQTVDDVQIVTLLEQTMDKNNPREWYWALMDYGAHIKASHGNPNRRSVSYSRQSTFDGSLRQVRGAVIRHLTVEQATKSGLARSITDERLQRVLADLINEKLIQYDGQYYFLPR